MIRKIIKYFDRIILFGLIKILVKHVRNKQIITFSGWGMNTTTNPPWALTPKNEVLKFEKTHNELIQLIKNKKFNLTQFSYKFKNDREKIRNSTKAVQELKWRHYIIYFSILYAKKFTKTKVNIVECGVADGMGIFYAINALNKENANFTGYLFDSWAKIKKEHLQNTDEMKHQNDYWYLDIKNTKNNLCKYSKNLIYNAGYIPEILQSSNLPNNISWLHIDLNSSSPTLKTLELLYDRLGSGAIILLDDYGHKTYELTRTIANKFFEDKNGQFINIPTGQGIFFKV